MRDRGYERSARFYDLFDKKENVDFFYHYAAQAGEVLDVGAGTGRIAIPLAERGVEVVCVEPSPAMRAQFEARLASRPDLGRRISLVAADAASFKLGRVLPAAFLSGSFDHFLSRAERAVSLENIAAHLVAGGTLVFDVFLGLMEDSPLSPAGRARVGEVEYRRLVGSRILPDRTIEVTLVFKGYRDGVLVERVEQRSRAGIVDRAEVHCLLGEGGFVVRREFCDYRFMPYEEGDELLVVEAGVGG